MNDEERPPTPEEIAEAEALARALEAKGSPDAASAAAPADALAAATLLRRARAAQEAEAQAAGRIAAAEARVIPAVAGRRPKRRRWSWLAPALFLPAAAAVLLMFVVRRPSTSGGYTAAGPLPAPPVALLEAQARAAGGGTDLAALDQRMRDYRERVYAALAARTGDGQ